MQEVSKPEGRNYIFNYIFKLQFSLSLQRGKK